MATDLSREILKQLEQLPPDEQLQILAEVQRRSENRSTTPGSRSILELEGLGAELWREVEAQEYVRRERDSWNG